jgi:head-tail adaptor
MGALAGRLSERVRFERRAARGSAGEPVGDWELLFERWARVELLGAGSSGVADGRHAARRLRVTVRSGPAVSLDMRIVWRGAALRLVGVEADPARPLELRMLAEDMGG